MCIEIYKSEIEYVFFLLNLERNITFIIFLKHFEYMHKLRSTDINELYMNKQKQFCFTSGYRITRMSIPQKQKIYNLILHSETRIITYISTA